MSSNQKNSQNVESGGSDKDTGVVVVSHASKKVSKCVRIMTVSAYLFAVSFMAIVLSLYYLVFWQEKKDKHWVGVMMRFNFNRCIKVSGDLLAWNSCEWLICKYCVVFGMTWWRGTTCGASSCKGCPLESIWWPLCGIDSDYIHMYLYSVVTNPLWLNQWLIFHWINVIKMDMQIRV